MENLPLELTEKIIITSVIDTLHERFIRYFWEEQAKKRLKELKMVCSSWQSIIKTTGFKAAFQRVFDRSYAMSSTLAQLMSKESKEHTYAANVMKLKDKLYIASSDLNICTKVLYIYQCKDNDFEEENKFHIPVREMFGMVACHNSLYFLGTFNSDECVRLMKVPVKRPDSEVIMVAQFTSFRESLNGLSVTNNGDPIVYENNCVGKYCKLMVFDQSGCIKQCIDLADHENSNLLAMTRSLSGKIIMICYGRKQRTLVEVDLDSNIIRSYEPNGLDCFCRAMQDSQYWLLSLSDGRVCLINLSGGDEGYLAVLDSNYNFCTVKTLDAYGYDEVRQGYGVHYDVERRQLIVVSSSIRVFELY